MRAGERTPPTVGDGDLIDRLKAVLGRRIHRQKPGPKPGSKRTEERRERAWEMSCCTAGGQNGRLLRNDWS